MIQVRNAMNARNGKTLWPGMARPCGTCVNYWTDMIPCEIVWKLTSWYDIYHVIVAPRMVCHMVLKVGWASRSSRLWKLLARIAFTSAVTWIAFIYIYSFIYVVTLSSTSFVTLSYLPEVLVKLSLLGCDLQIFFHVCKSGVQDEMLLLTAFFWTKMLSKLSTWSSFASSLLTCKRWSKTFGQIAC